MKLASTMKGTVRSVHPPFERLSFVLQPHLSVVVRVNESQEVSLNSVREEGQVAEPWQHQLQTYSQIQQLIHHGCVHS